MKRLSAILMAAMLCAGCAATFQPEQTALGQADARLEAQDYRGAAGLYSEFLKTNREDPQAARARATQAALDRLLALQTELERIKQGELPRLQRELAERQNEAERLKGEVAKLRADIERLRNIDLQEMQRGLKK